MIRQFRPRRISDIPTNDDFNRLQNSLDITITPLVANISNDSKQISVSLVANVSKIINHGLGRNLIGWEVCDKDQFADIKRLTSKSPDLTLILESNANVNIIIRVY